MRSLRSRFMYTPPWKLTQWGFLLHYFGRINRGGDGVYLSRFVIIPLVGEFCWFDKHPDPNSEGITVVSSEVFDWLMSDEPDA